MPTKSLCHSACPNMVLDVAPIEAFSAPSSRYEAVSSLS